MGKKLQVFVSSTYDDMKAERQAVIEAILRAGHIPAGMELFAAGDKSQLEIIRRWIEDSDVYMLILGGRYGTIEKDSGKSYIQLEYEFADSTNKPYFAAVMDEQYLDQKVRDSGKAVLEQERPDLLKQFKRTVTSKICRFFKTTEDLKLVVLESVLDIERNRDLVGWVRADALPNPAPLIEEIAQLRRENTALRAAIKSAKERPANDPETMAALTGQLELAGQSLKFMEAQYAAGTTNLLEVNRARSLYLDAKMRLLQARGEAVTLPEPAPPSSDPA